MNTIRKFSKHVASALALVLGMALTGAPGAAVAAPGTPPEKDQRIMIALLLDTSNSMDGLIDQAKSQLWKIVNELAAARCSDGSRPDVKIALYEYGNDNLSARAGYVRLVSALTSDLDLISEKLFALTTNGGSEYCGYVINQSLKDLEWSRSDADLKMIFIAGNEPFTQGSVPYTIACSLAREKDVTVSTIYCGPYGEGAGTSWKSGADLTGGTYMSIEQDRRTVYVPTPYDKEIDALNSKLNATYVYYGESGERRKQQQIAQDRNAARFGQENKVERAVSKSTHVYKNSSWDLVDAYEDDAGVIEEAREADLPAEMRGMTTAEKEEYIEEKAAERARIQHEIQALNEKRKEYIAQHTEASAEKGMLDAAMLKAIKEKARMKNFSW